MPQLPSSKNNNSGFTLVEVMVAIMILMIGMFGLLEAITASVQHNMRNQLRDEGVHVGERQMAMLRGLPFDTSNLYVEYPALTVTSKIRGVEKSYSVQRSSQPLASDDKGTTSRQFTVTVKWAFRNQSTVNQLVSVVPRP